jgi:hypothetical protein
MPKRGFIVTGVVAFGAGVAFGSLWPKAGNLVENILKKLGLEWAELLLLWDPEARVPAKRVKAKTKLAKRRKPASRQRISKPVRIAAPRKGLRSAKAMALRN